MQSGNPVTVYSQSITDRTKLTPTFSKQVHSVFIGSLVFIFCLYRHQGESVSPHLTLNQRYRLVRGLRVLI